MKYIFLWCLETKNMGSCIEFDMMCEYIYRGNLNNVIHIDEKNIHDFDLKDMIENQDYKMIILASIQILRKTNDFMRYIYQLPYIPKLKECIFIHMGDEGFDRPSDTDRNKLYSLFKGVVRFGNKDITKVSENIPVLPMGYISGMYGDGSILKSSQRKYIWAWLGSLKLDRRNMLETLSNTTQGEYFIRNSQNWKKAMHLSGPESKKIIRHSKFVPCSCGNAHVEGARYAEALESGAIPLIKKYKIGEVAELRFGFDDYYTLLFKNPHPLPSFYDWNEMKDFIDNISDTDLDILQNKCINWWVETKTFFGLELSNFIKSKY